MAGDELFEIEVSHDGGETVIRVRGEIDRHARPAFRRAVEEAWIASPHLVLDMSETSFIDGSGLGVLAAAAHAYGRDAVTVRSPTPGLRRLLEITGIADVVRVHDVVADEP